MKNQWWIYICQWKIYIFVGIGLAIIYLIYAFLHPRKKEWVRDYLIPIFFFLFLIYRSFSQALSVFRNAGIQLSYRVLLSINNIVVITFMSLAIVSYILRSKPIKKAIGIKERIFPLVVLFSQFLGSFIIAELATAQFKPNHSIHHLIAHYTRFNFNKGLYVTGLLSSILGTTLACFALWTLKRSFSIMVEIRPFISKGIYREIRHPLYASELLSVLGIAMLFNNAASYGLFIVLFIMQCFRAKLEEKKMSCHFPEYQKYKEQTGFFFPRLIRRDKDKGSGLEG